MSTLRITCGCNTEKNPASFNTVEEAQKHANATGHVLTITGIVRPDVSK